MTEDLLILGELIAEQAAHMDAAEHRLLTNIRQFDAQYGWVSAQSCAHWLAWRVGWTLGTAREHVRVAKALGNLPHIDEALRLGKVSYCKVRAMTRVATPANEALLLLDATLTTGSQLERICRKYRQVQRQADGPAPARDDVDRYVTRRDLDNGMVKIEAVLHPEEAALFWSVLEQATKELYAAGKHSTSQPDTDAPCDPGHAVAAVDVAEAPDETAAADSTGGGRITETAGAYENDCDRTESELDDDELPQYTYPWSEADLVGEHRSLRAGSEYARPRRTRRDDISAETTGATARTTGSTQSASTTPSSATKPSAATSASTNPSASTQPSLRFDRADGLVAMVRRFAMGDLLRSPVEVVVTIPSVALQSGAAPLDEQVGFLHDDSCITSEAARRLSCDAGVVYMTEDPHGQPLTVGRRTRTIPSRIQRALAKRDRCCRFPGCTNRIYLDGHHIEHWADGGETCLSNLVRLCSRHHRFVHEYGYTVKLDSEGQPLFFDPRGRPAKDVPPRIDRADLGWQHIVDANRDLGIVPHRCRWDGLPIQYSDICHGLYLLDAKGS